MSTSIENKTVVVTGATSGIGFATVSELAGRGAFIVAVGRTTEKCREAEDKIKSAHPEAAITFLAADLSSQEEIASLAGSISTVLTNAGKNAIDVLIHIAGIFTGWYVSTREGIEMQFAVNHLAPFLLTHHLIRYLKASPSGRVVTMSSGSHYHTRIRWNDIMLKKHYNCLLAYKQSKLCNVLFSLELRRRIRDANISVFAADPGLVNTEMGLKNTSGIAKWVWSCRKKKGITPEEAARSIVWLAAESSIENADKLYWKYCRPKNPSKFSRDSEAARRLWLVSERMCGIDSGSFGI